MDESAFSERPPVRRTWAPKGQPPVLKESWSWKKFSAIGAIGYKSGKDKPRLFFTLKKGSIRTEEILSFLASLRRLIRGKVILVWDNLPAHKGKAVKQYVNKNWFWLSVEHLPPYAPELNPVELLYANLKGTSLANFIPMTMEELKSKVYRSSNKIRRTPTTLKGFIRGAKWGD